jgi:uncharacterized protein (TIGR02118 family)
VSAIYVMYPNEAGSHFNKDYYFKHHAPLVRRLLEPAGLRQFSVAEIVAPATYQLIAQLEFDDLKIATNAVETHGAELQADVRNFTNVPPVVLFVEEKQV